MLRKPLFSGDSQVSAFKFYLHIIWSINIIWNKLHVVTDFRYILLDLVTYNLVKRKYSTQYTTLCVTLWENAILDHVYNPLLRKTITSLPGNDVNKFRRKRGGPDHLWSSNQTKMVKKTKVWVNFIGFVKQKLAKSWHHLIYPPKETRIAYPRLLQPWLNVYLKSLWLVIIAIKIHSHQNHLINDNRFTWVCVNLAYILYTVFAMRTLYD